MSDPIREAFEKWAITWEPWADVRRMGYESHPGEYRAYSVESAWRGWQEAWRQSAAQTKVESPSDYDAGLLSDFGGGDVGWWQDYIRSEIGRANDYWRDIHSQGGKP